MSWPCWAVLSRPSTLTSATTAMRATRAPASPAILARMPRAGRCGMGWLRGEAAWYVALRPGHRMGAPPLDRSAASSDIAPDGDHRPLVGDADLQRAPLPARHLGAVLIAQRLVLGELGLVQRPLVRRQRGGVGAEEQLEHAGVAQLRRVGGHLSPQALQRRPPRAGDRVEAPAPPGLLPPLAQQPTVGQPLDLAVDLGVRRGEEVVHAEGHERLEVVRGQLVAAGLVEEAEDDVRGRRQAQVVLQWSLSDGTVGTMSIVPASRTDHRIGFADQTEEVRVDELAVSGEGAARRRGGRRGGGGGGWGAPSSGPPRPRCPPPAARSATGSTGWRCSTAS